MGALVCELIPPDAVRTRSLFLQTGPFLVVALALLERLTHQGLISPYVDPIIQALFTFIRSL
jgi:hypothetical protein